MKPKKYYGEYPDIAIPAILQGPEWQDQSWHNDACAKSESTEGLPAGLTRQVWVDYDDKDLREMGGPKYCVLVIDNDTGYAADGNEEGETADSELTTLIQTVRARYAK